MTLPALRAPFPYAGGKGRRADLIWKHFGNPWGFFEPFFGSGAVLLARPTPCEREIVCDTNGYICNLWRSIQADPDAVAYWADWPTIHDDLTARRLYLIEWYEKLKDRLREDHEFYDAKAAGFWCWGMAHWIGGSRFPEGDAGESIPHVKTSDSGQGVSVQRKTLPVNDRIPHMKDIAAGRGVSIQRKTLPTGDQIPHVNNPNGGQGVSMQRKTGVPGPDDMDVIPAVSASAGGRGVSMQRHRVPATPGIIDGSRLRPWMRALCVRIQRVQVFNRPWSTICNSERTILGQLDGSKFDPPREVKSPTIAILMDPPYLTDERTNTYDKSFDGKDDVARDAYEWSVENGERFRIAYCAHLDDFPIPDGWTFATDGFMGIRRADRRKERRDVIMFSPACIEPQPGLFD